jgi:hypothetical protein
MPLVTIAAQIPITNICAHEESTGANRTRSDANLAIDDDEGTYSWQTEVGVTDLAVLIGYDFNGSATVNQLRLLLENDLGYYGVGDLDILYSTDTTSAGTTFSGADWASGLTWQPVTGLANGAPGGGELFSCDSVIPATATLQNHSGTQTGWASVTFDAVTATALAVRLRDATGPYYHYPVYEVEAYVPEPATLSFLALGGLAILRRRR